MHRCVTRGWVYVIYGMGKDIADMYTLWRMDPDIYMMGIAGWI